MLIMVGALLATLSSDALGLEQFTIKEKKYQSLTFSTSVKENTQEDEDGMNEKGKVVSLLLPFTLFSFSCDATLFPIISSKQTVRKAYLLFRYLLI